MQLALRPWSAGSDLITDRASVTRTNKILIGTVAALSASVIAVSPAAQSSSALELHQIQQAQQRAIELVAEVTDSPLAVYGGLVSNTVYDLTTLFKQYAAAPLPILSAVVSNTEGYLKRIFDLSPVATAFQTWWNDGTRESAPGKTLLASVGSALASGNIALAYQNFNSLALFGIQNTVLPWLNNWFFGTATSPSIFTQMAQNLTNAATAFFTTGTLVYGAFQSLYAPVSGASFALARALGSVGSALGSGNVVGALTALVNTPGYVVNALLNGFDYDGAGATNPWAGLLSPKDPACTGRCAGGGPISQFFITIAQKIAAAIKNVSATTTTTAATAAATTAAVSKTLDSGATAAYTLSLDSDTTSTPVAAAAATTDSASAATADDSSAKDKSAKAKARAAKAAKNAATTEATATDSSATEATAADSSATDDSAKSTHGKRGAHKSDSAGSSSTASSSTSTSSSTGSSSASGDSASSGSAKSKSGDHKHASKHASKHSG